MKLGDTIGTWVPVHKVKVSWYSGHFTSGYGIEYKSPGDWFWRWHQGHVGLDRNVAIEEANTIVSDGGFYEYRVFIGPVTI